MHSNIADAMNHNCYSVKMNPVLLLFAMLLVNICFIILIFANRFEHVYNNN